MQNGIWRLPVVFLTAKLPSERHQSLPMTRTERIAQIETRPLALRDSLEA